MKTLRPALLSMLLALTAQTVIAQEHDRVFMRRFMNPADTMTTMPLMAWGPGTMVSTPAVMGRLFPPTMIMQRQNELALTDQQQEAIKAELREFQSSVVDIQWDLQSSQGALESLLEEDRIDAEAATAAIDRVLTAENALKKLHLTLLIHIRNALQPDQIAKLEKSMRGPHVWSMGVMPEPPEPPPTP